MVLRSTQYRMFCTGRQLKAKDFAALRREAAARREEAKAKAQGYFDYLAKRRGQGLFDKVQRAKRED